MVVKKITFKILQANCRWRNLRVSGAVYVDGLCRKQPKPKRCYETRCPLLKAVR
jgi:hypothetical protein